MLLEAVFTSVLIGYYLVYLYSYILLLDMKQSVSFLYSWSPHYQVCTSYPPVQVIFHIFLVFVINYISFGIKVSLY